MNPLCLVLVFAIACASCPGQARPDAEKSHPLDLASALRLSVSNNPGVQLARHLLAMALGDQDHAADRFFPSASSSAKFFKQDDLTPGTKGPSFDDRREYDASATFAAQLPLRDAIYNAGAAAQLVAAARGDLRIECQNTALRAAEAYFDFALADATVKARREAIADSESYQNQLRLLVEHGGANPADETPVRVQSESFRAALSQALQQQRQATDRLARVLQLPLSARWVAPDLSPGPITVIDPNATLPSLLQRALEFRPELAQIRARKIAVAEAQAAVRYGPLIPTLGAELFGGGLGGLAGSSGTAKAHYGQIEESIIALSWKFGAGGLFDTASLKAAQARATGLEMNERTCHQVIGQVIQNRECVSAFYDQLGAAQQTLERAAAAVPPAGPRGRFDPGVIPAELLARQQLADAKLAYASAATEYNKAQYSLVWAIGRDLR